jgi:putative oxidoreductase
LKNLFNRLIIPTYLDWSYSPKVVSPKIVYFRLIKTNTMNKTYATNLNLPTVDAGLLILRIGVAGLMLTHGVPKLISLFGNEEIQFADPFGLGQATTLMLAVFAEFLCSLLVLVGLGTRLAVIPLMVTMLTAIFVAHAGDPFRGKELSVFYFIIYLVLLITGAGKYALDFYWLKRKRE